MMGYNGTYCQNLQAKDQNTNSARHDLYQQRKTDLVNELVDPICVISNANDILSNRLRQFVDDETKSYFEMIARSATKTKALVEELRHEISIQ
jgi:hypothetical protein